MAHRFVHVAAATTLLLASSVALASSNEGWLIGADEARWATEDEKPILVLLSRPDSDAHRRLSKSLLDVPMVRDHLDSAVPKIVVPVAEALPDPKNQSFYQEMVGLAITSWPSFVIWKPGSGWEPFELLISEGQHGRQMSPGEFVAALDKTFPSPAGIAPADESEARARVRSFLAAVGGTNDQLDALKGAKLREDGASQLPVWSSKAPFPGGDETTVHFSGLVGAWWIESAVSRDFELMVAELSSCAALWSTDVESSSQGTFAAPARAYTHDCGDTPITISLKERGRSTTLRISR